MFEKFLRRLFGRCQFGRRAAAKPLRPQARPQVEGLEDRLAPATIDWTGNMTGAGDWSIPQSWVGTRVPGAADTPRFIKATSSPTLSDNVAIAALDVWARQSNAGPNNSNTTVDLATKTLKVTRLINVHSEAFAVGKAVRGIADNAVFTVKSSGGKATMSTETLDVGSAGFQGATLTQNKASLTVTKDVTLDVTGSVHVGGNTTGTLQVDAGGKLKGSRLLVGGISSTVDYLPSVSGVTVSGVGAVAEFKSIALGSSNGFNGFNLNANKPRYTTLTVDNGGKVTLGPGIVSLVIGSDYRGVATVQGGSQLTAEGVIFVGSLDTSSRGTGLLTVKDTGTVVTTGSVLGVGYGKGSGDLVVGAGATVNAAELHIGNAQAKGTATLTGTAAKEANLTITGGSTVHQGGTLEVKTGGKLTSNGVFTIDAGPGRRAETGGTVRVRDGGSIDAKVGGTNNGTLKIDTGGVLKVHPTGAINKGVIQIAGAGGVGAGVALVQGNFSQTAAGELDVDIFGNMPGASYDVLAVSAADGGDNNVTLGGSLHVTASYAPTPFKFNGTAGDYFTVVTATGSLSGQFDPVTGLQLPDPTQLGLPAPASGTEYRWRVIYDTSDSYNSALAQSDPALASQPWTGNGTKDAVLVIEEVATPTLATTTTLATSASSIGFGQPVTFTAVVSATSGTPSGVVTFSNGLVPLGAAALDGTGTATFTTSSLAVGSSTIRAYYQGSPSYAESTTSALSQTITTASSSTALTSSLNPAVSGDFVTFAATVSGTGATPTGTITFMDGSTALDSETLDASGTANFTTSSLASSSHTISAVYGGDSNFGGSTSSSLTESVSAAGRSSHRGHYWPRSPNLPSRSTQTAPAAQLLTFPRIEASFLLGNLCQGRDVGKN